MSDLTSNYGCGCGRNERSGGCNNSCMWIILLLLFCGGNGSGRSGFGGCDSCTWIILLLLFCGGNTFGLGNNDDCGCGC